MHLILRQPFANAKASKDAPEDASGAVWAPWIVLRGPFGAPPDLIQDLIPDLIRGAVGL